MSAGDTPSPPLLTEGLHGDPKQSMQGKIDTSFATVQRDFFASGLAAEIGMNALGVWLAVKQHADFNSGKAWPGVRRLAEWTGLNKDTVSKQLKVLEAHRLLRSSARGRGKTYIARERLDIRLGEMVLCTIVVDYVPMSLRSTLGKIQDALKSGTAAPEAWAEVEIIPGDGFRWDATAGVLRGRVDVREIPDSPGPKDEFDKLAATLLGRAPRLPKGVPKK